MPQDRSAQRNRILLERRRQKLRYRSDPNPVRRRFRRFMERNPDYFKRWYRRNRDYVRARVALYAACFPDRVARAQLKRDWGLSPGKSPMPPEQQMRAEEVYRESLRKLRRLFGRDPDTGHLLKEKR